MNAQDIATYLIVGIGISFVLLVGLIVLSVIYQIKIYKQTKQINEKMIKCD